MKKFLILGIILALFACNQQKTAGKAYVAKIDGTVITEEMMNEEVNALPEQVKMMFMNENGTTALLNELINKEILYKEAKKKGLDKDKRLERAVNEFKKISMVKLLLSQEIESKASVADQDLRKYYDEHKEDFRVRAPGRKENGQIMGFDSVKELIRQRLMAEKQEKVFAAYVDGLKKNYKIEINDEALKKMNQRKEGIPNIPIEPNSPEPPKAK